jgi:hypothetical protein
MCDGFFVYGLSMTSCNTSERLHFAFRLPVTHVWGRDCQRVTRFAPQHRDRLCWHLPYDLAKMHKDKIHVAFISWTLCQISLFWKNKSRFMRSPCSHCIPPINSWMPEPIFMTFGLYIMAPEPIPTAYLITPSHQSACLYVLSPYRF